MNWNDVASASVTLFLIMDPLGNAPIFNAVLASLERPVRVIVVARELLIALLILFGFLVAGNTLMLFLGLTRPALSIAGGILLFMISLRMVFPTAVTLPVQTEQDSPFIVPLAVPLIAGPSSITVLLLLSSSRPDQLTEWALALLLAWLATTILLLVSPLLLALIGQRGSRALVRLMGMILVILATQMLLDGIQEFVQNLER